MIDILGVDSLNKETYNVFKDVVVVWIWRALCFVLVRMVWTSYLRRRGYLTIFNRLLMVLLEGCLGQSTVLKDCNTYENETVYYRAGENISLCCTLSKKVCSELTDNDKVRIININSPQRTPSDDVVIDTIINCPGVKGKNQGNATGCERCSYRFQKENVTISDDGIYHCYINKQSISWVTVHVVGKRNPSKILKLSVSEQSVMTVEFEKGDCYPWVYDFNVTMEGQKKVTTLCSMNCNLCQDTCICRFDPNNEALNRNPQNLTVIAFFKNKNMTVQSVNWTGEYKLFEHIVPSEVVDLKLFNVSANEAIIMFRPNAALMRKLQYMENVGKPLYYEVVLNRTQGLSEVLRMAFKKTVLNSSEYRYQFVAIRFTNLTSFTTYSSSVTGVGGGGEGNSTILVFTTNKTVPLSPPKVNALTYSRSLGENNTSSSLYLIWHPLPAASRGGSNVSFHLMVTSVIGSIIAETTVDSSFTLIGSLPPRDPLTVKIWSKNEIGLSESYSTLEIPAYPDVQPSAYVEYDLQNNLSYVFININGFESVEMIAIHKCDVSQGSLCTTYPYTQIKQVNSSKRLDGGHLMFDFPLIPSVTLRTFEINNEMKYFDTEDGANPFQNPNGLSASANVTFDVNECEGLWDTPNPDVYPRFYISIHFRESWLGMVMTECNFTRQSGNVDLEQNLDQGNKPYLRFKQKCMSENPSQFLAKYFTIYALTNDSLNAECDGPEVQKVDNMTNNMFSYNTIVLPSSKKAACIEAFGFDSSRSYKTKTLQYGAVSQPITGSSSTNSMVIVTVVLSCVGGIIAVAIIVCMVKVCISRRNHYREFEVNKKSEYKSNLSLQELQFDIQNPIQETSDLPNGQILGASEASDDSGCGTMERSQTPDVDANRDESPTCQRSCNTSNLFHTTNGHTASGVSDISFQYNQSGGATKCSCSSSGSTESSSCSTESSSCSTESSSSSTESSSWSTEERDNARRKQNESSDSNVQQNEACKQLGLGFNWTIPSDSSSFNTS